MLISTKQIAVSDLVDRLRHQLPHNADGGYHNVGIGYFDRKDVAEAADAIEMALRSLDCIWVFSMHGDQYPEQKAEFETALRVLRGSPDLNSPEPK